ncbi:MAG TPA: hypothetical protein VI728_04855, partial [Syntrophales bacterium]|nr:hypothetical protein [Syntrophales bacterium]
LTGERPFGGDNFSTVSYKIVHVDPIPPRVINPAVPEIYNRILSKLLRKDPDQRYQSGAELMEDLKRASGGGALESIPADEMIVTTPAVEPAKQADSEKRIQGAEKASPSSPEQREALLYATVILFAAVALVAGVSSHRPVQAPPAPVKQVEIPPLSKQEDPLLAMSRQNTIRIKWDLAVNYYQNGLYDKSIEQLNALLAIDPSHQEARKYLDLVKARKESEEKIRMTKLDPGKKTSSGTRADTNIVEKRSKLPAPPVSKVKTETMQFELEHTLPSGTFSVFLGDKLIYQAVLAGTEKKILMFRSYKGRLTGSLELPVGQSTLGLRVVNKEFGISVFKKLSTRLEEGDSRVLKIRFLKATRELDAKWT